MTGRLIVRQVATVLTGLGLLTTLTALALLIAGPTTSYTMTRSAHGGPAYAGVGEMVWTTWPTVAICAGITIALGTLAIRLRRAS